MKRTAKLLLLLLALILLVACQAAVLIRQLVADDLLLLPEDRLLVLAPHPDDEVLGSGGIIQQAVAMEIPVHIVFLTNGDFNEWSFTVYRRRPSITPGQVRQMGLVRHNEALAAAAVMGVPAENVTFLGYPDIGTLDIWYSHWGDSPPYRSRLTRVMAVPYPDALRPGAEHKGESILQDLTTILRDFRPTKIFVSHPADTHPDHRAMYLFTRVALWDLAGEMAPELYPYLVHYPGWPQPRRYDPAASLDPPPDLDESISWQIYTLATDEVEGKLAALQEHRTQMASNARFLNRFIRTNELFGDFPEVVLQPGAAASLMDSDEAEATPSIPEALTEAERVLFVEAQAESIRLEDDEVVLELEFSRPLAAGTNVSLYVFGYRQDLLFAEMPKLHVRFGPRSQAVFDQNSRLSPDQVRIARQSRRVTVRVPMGLLNNSDRLFVTARSYTQRVPLDWDPWRIVELDIMAAAND